MSPPSDPERFGRYRLITELGSGGMSKVHLAVAESGPQIGRKLIVLKLLQEHLQADADFTKLFVREARIAVEMSHSNVVHTHTVGEQDGRNYILMEYLEGVSLRTIMKASADWSLRDRLPLFGGICMALTGLHYVHEFHDHNGTHLNLVHRDIKPDNVFITADGQVKLLDFGVARVESPDFERTLGTSVRGTVQYLAPESVQPNVTVDRRADVFSVGVILAELATGRRFWGSDPYTKILASLATGDIPSIEPRSGEEVPPPLLRVCEQALKVDRNERFKTAIELRVALLRFLTKQGYRIDPTELAAIVKPLFEPIRLEREVLIQHSLSDLEVSTIGHLPPSESSTFPGPATMPAIGDRTTPASFPSAPTSAPVEPEPPRRRAAMWMVPLLVLPLIGLGAYQCTTDDERGAAATREAAAPAAGDRTPDAAGRPAEASVAPVDDAQPRPAGEPPSPAGSTTPPEATSSEPSATPPVDTAPAAASSPVTDDEPIVEDDPAGEAANDDTDDDETTSTSRSTKRKRRATRPSPPPKPAPAPEPEPEPEPEPTPQPAAPKPAKPAATKPTGIEPNPYSR